MPIRSCALLHVHYDPGRSVVIGYKFALNYCPDYDIGDHDLATIGPNRNIMRRSHQARSVTSATIDQSQLIVTFSDISSKDTRHCESMRSDKIWCAWSQLVNFRLTDLLR